MRKPRTKTTRQVPKSLLSTTPKPPSSNVAAMTAIAQQVPKLRLTPQQRNATAGMVAPIIDDEASAVQVVGTAVRGGDIIIAAAL